MVLLIVLSISIPISVTLLLSSILSHNQADPDDSYRFCLATATSAECVRRPGSILGKKISKSPDKLLRYFASIPERVQQQWRVWVMDDEQSKTIEMTVAEFYSWMDSYRESRVAHEN